MTGKKSEGEDEGEGGYWRHGGRNDASCGFGSGLRVGGE